MFDNNSTNVGSRGMEAYYFKVLIYEMISFQLKVYCNKLNKIYIIISIAATKKTIESYS